MRTVDDVSVTVPSPLRSAAIFDLDRTLLPGSSLIQVGRLALRNGLISPRTLAKGLWEDARYRLQGSNDSQVRDLHEQLLAMAAGVDASMMDELAEQAAPRIVDDMRDDVRSRLEHHLELGDLVVILSASPDEVVRRVAVELGAHHGFGTRAQRIHGVYTGHLDGAPCYGNGKLSRLLEAELPIDASRSFAYADSMSDLPILRWVTHPVVVSPDAGLRDLATAEGWPIVEPDRLGRRRQWARSA